MMLGWALRARNLAVMGWGVAQMQAQDLRERISRQRRYKPF